MNNASPKIKRALISVSDKQGLDTLAAALVAQGAEIISSGGTLKYLAERGIAATPIEQVTGNPECFGGRMKTLSFPVASAILYRRGHEMDEAEATAQNIRAIDLVVCNLYPFESVAKTNPPENVLIENIDIGGPTLIRAAAKNHADVAVVTCPAQYAELIAELETHAGATTFALRQKLALAAFRHTARYDGMIAAKLEDIWQADGRTIVITPDTGTPLRYGENPHQSSHVHADPFQTGIAGTAPLQGKELSYNNLLDADAAWRSCGDAALVAPADFPAVVSIIKHLSPCGVAAAKTPIKALEQAWAGDPVSSFGGILAFNMPVDVNIAVWLADRFVEVIVAPAFTPDALAIFARKPNLRLLALSVYDGSYKQPMVRSISGGYVVQQEDTGADADFKPATANPFPPAKSALARFGVMACKHLKSNAIGLFAETPEGFSMIGAGMGNPNRLVSMKQAVEKAHENGHADLQDTVLVSDAFFPFADNIAIAAAAGIRYIVQPGGSVKDKDVIQACEEQDIAMAFTGRRHFRH